MVRKCINCNCESKRSEKLEIDNQTICQYYHVPYKPYQQVCTCHKIYKNSNRSGKKIKSQECIFNNETQAQPKYNELSNKEEMEENIEDTQETALSNCIKTVRNKSIDYSVDVQLQICKDHMNSEKHKHDINRQFHYKKEVNIIDNNPEKINKHNEVMTVENKLIKPQRNFHSENKPSRHLLQPGDQVYAQKMSLLQPWLKATVQSVINNIYFNISFDGDGEKKILTNNNLAYINAINTQYPISSRIIALFKDVNIKMTDNFYAGTIAEPPTHKNKYRYMIFFDSGYTQYVKQNDIRLVCSKSKEISDVHENVRDFIKAYFKTYPNRTMVNFNETKFVYAELNREWSAAMVTNLDASLVQLKFLNQECEHIEWMYRGSNRLNLIYDQLNKNIQDLQSSNSIVNVDKTINQPYIELDNAEMDEIDNPNSGINPINLPPNIIKPLSYEVHKCNHLCMSWIQYDYSKTKNMNTLSIPLYFGFERIIIPNENSDSDKVVYKSPCGFILNNEYEMYNYLKKAKNNNFMTIDFFNFDDFVNPLVIYRETKYLNYIDDISYKMEFKPISAVNCLDHRDPPAMKYITERTIDPDVNVNLDTQFLCSCDCINNCENKTKCSCWQLTYEYKNKFPQAHRYDTIGYTYKRLYEPVYTGIYECNKNCKCMKTCLNRVVQEPMSSILQVFLTENKGWGLKTLVDIPKGSFVCTLIGALHTEKEAEIDAKKYGDEYLAELDYIERVEEFKEDYESDVDPIATESDNKSSSSDEEFNPGGQVLKSKIKFDSKMSLRRNVQNTKIKTDGVYQSSKLNTRQGIVTKTKSLRKYFDSGCGIYTLDAKVSGNVGRYVNHSCDPNLFVQNVFVDSHDLRFPWIAYFALKYIPAGTELTWDYSYTIGSVKNKQLICYCGSENCRGRLL